MAITEEQQAISFVLEHLCDEGMKWLRKEKAANSTSTRVAQSKFTFLSKDEVQRAIASGKPKEELAKSRLIPIVPPPKEIASVAAIWYRWDYRNDPAKVGYYFGIWSNLEHFPRYTGGAKPARSVGFLGYRFESPEEGDDHNYYHSQPCRSMGAKDDEVEGAVPVSARMPTFPLPANSALDLLLCMITAIYGMKGLADLKKATTQDRRGRAKILSEAIAQLQDRQFPKPKKEQPAAATA
jgi:hypothetical protein